MIDLFKLKDLITLLPLLIIYILPGYVFISIKNFIGNINQSDDKNDILKSIVISYIIINFESLICLHVGKFILDISSPKSIIFTVCFTVAIAYIYSRIMQCEFSYKLLKYLKITRSLKGDILTDIMDFEMGMWIRVFIKPEEVIYVGKIRKFEKNGDSNYTVVLSNFILYGYSGEEFINNQDNNHDWVVVNVKDTYRIELVYNPKSKKIVN